MHIALRNVTVGVPGRTLLRGVELEAPPGAAIVVTGPTGAGRTSLLKVVAGLLPPAGGTVLHDGESLADLPAARAQAVRRRIGFVFEDAALWANTSLLGNLELPLRARRPELDAAARRRRIEAVLAELDWSLDLAQRPAALSPGEQLLLGFLRAVLPGPEVLILDDTPARLDLRRRAALLERLAALRAGGTTVIVGVPDPALAPLPGAHHRRLAGGRLEEAPGPDTP